MKEKIYSILRQRNLDVSNYNIDILYKAGIKMIVDNVEFYYDKPYSCESVLKELFNRGIIEELKKAN